MTRLPVLIALLLHAACAQGNDAISCDDIKDIRTMPFGSEPVDDVAYNRLVTQGMRINACLVDKIADSSPMRDPRKAPSYGDFTVGDAAYSLFVRINGLRFEELLPDDVVARFRSDGVYAYFAHVAVEGNRARLAETCRSYVSGQR